MDLYGYTSKGVKVNPPKGWVILAEGQPVPSTHWPFFEDYSDGRAWWREQPCRSTSTMTAINARVCGSVRAYAVPE